MTMQQQQQSLPILPPPSGRRRGKKRQSTRTTLQLEDVGESAYMHSHLVPILSSGIRNMSNELDICIGGGRALDCTLKSRMSNGVRSLWLSATGELE